MTSRECRIRSCSRSRTESSESQEMEPRGEVESSGAESQSITGTYEWRMDNWLMASRIQENADPTSGTGGTGAR